MAFIASSSGKVAYGVKKLILDFETELGLIKTETLSPGSTAFVIETSNTYMLNSKHEWKKIKSTNSGGGGSDDPSENEDVIYEGGVEV